jgi:uncharacterized protein YqeY
MTEDQPAPIRDRLRAALTTAMKARDTPAVEAIRTALAAIDNAEAVEIADTTAFTVSRIAGSAGALGAAERSRRSLTEDEMAELVEREATDRRAAAEGYEQEGYPERAEELRTSAAVLDGLLHAA